MAVFILMLAGCAASNSSSQSEKVKHLIQRLQKA